MIPWEKHAQWDAHKQQRIHCLSSHDIRRHALLSVFILITRDLFMETILTKINERSCVRECLFAVTATRIQYIVYYYWSCIDRAGNWFEIGGKSIGRQPIQMIVMSVGLFLYSKWSQAQHFVIFSLSPGSAGPWIQWLWRHTGCGQDVGDTQSEYLCTRQLMFLLIDP